jgi:hypothetical protein
MSVTAKLRHRFPLAVSALHRKRGRSDIVFEASL